MALTSIPKVDDPPALAQEATELRREIVEALFECGGGHYGGSLSVVDLLLVLYRRLLRVRPEHPRAPDRDRLILSKGHAAIALYAVLRRLGFLDQPLASYGRLGSPLEGHPDVTALPAVEFSTGSLGQGLSAGAGMALALRDHGSRVWVVLGDGECQEGQVWEAALLAARYRLDNLVAVIDANRFQEWGMAGATGSHAEPVPALAQKWAAFGWRALEVDGHDHGCLADVLDEATATEGRPCAVVAATVKGKGVPLAEADPLRFHCTEVTAEEHAEMLRSFE